MVVGSSVVVVVASGVRVVAGAGAWVVSAGGTVVGVVVAAYSLSWQLWRAAALSLFSTASAIVATKKANRATPKNVSSLLAAIQSEMDLRFFFIVKIEKNC